MRERNLNYKESTTCTFVYNYTKYLTANTYIHVKWYTNFLTFLYQTMAPVVYDCYK